MATYDESQNINRNLQGYYGAATGKGRQSAKAELEKLNLAEGGISLEQGVKDLGNREVADITTLSVSFLGIYLEGKETSVA